MRVTLFPVLVASSLVPNVVAWGAAGHEITATIAQMHLFPETLEAVCSFFSHRRLNASDEESATGCSLAPIATWADRIRGLPQYRWASSFHYVGGVGDWPPSHCVFGENGWEGKEGVNVLSGIMNTTRWLREGKEGGTEALKFLIHFMGDLHMPLHLTARDRGGNEDRVRWDHRLTNLHSVWDGRLITNAILATPRRYHHPVLSPEYESVLRGAIYDPYVRYIVSEGILDKWKDDLASWLYCPKPSAPAAGAQIPLGTQVGIDDEVVCPLHWSRPIHQLNCELVWPPELDWPAGDPPANHPILELDRPDYADKIKDQWVVEQLLAMAGIRMAAVLNGLFAGGGLYTH